MIGVIAINGLIGLAMAAAQAAAGSAIAQKPALDVSNAVRQGEVSKGAAESFIANCGLRRFDSEVLSSNGGKLRKARILLCAKPGESDEQWIATLDKAASQIDASPQLSAEAKAKVLGEIRAAIGQIRNPKSAQASPGAIIEPPAGQAANLPVPRVIEPMGGLEPLVATVRPLPPPPSQQIVAAVAPPPRPSVAKPPMTIMCSSAGDAGGGGDCDELTAATLITVRADANLTSRVLLRFVRDGDPRATIAIPPMRRGKLFQARLPGRVCGGVVRGRVVIETVVTDPRSGSEQVADSQGPMRLRC